MMKSTRPAKNGFSRWAVVVPLGEVAIDVDELEPDELEAALLVAGEDAADQLALDAVGLDEDEGPFGAWHVSLGTVGLDEPGLYRIAGRDQAVGPPAVASASAAGGRRRVGVGRGGRGARARRRCSPAASLGRSHGLVRSSSASASAATTRRSSRRRSARPRRARRRRRRRPARLAAATRTSSATFGQPAAGRDRVGLPRLRLVAGQPVRVAADDHQRWPAARALGRLEDGRRERRGEPQREPEAERRLVERPGDERGAPGLELARRLGSDGRSRRLDPSRRRPRTRASPGRRRALAAAAAAAAGAGDGSADAAAARLRRPPGRDRTGSAPSAAARRHRAARRRTAASRRRSRRSCRRRVGRSPASRAGAPRSGDRAAAAASAAMTSAIGSSPSPRSDGRAPPRPAPSRSPVRQRTSARSTRPLRVEAGRAPASVSSSTRASASDAEAQVRVGEDQLDRPAAGRVGSVGASWPWPSCRQPQARARGRAGSGPARRPPAAARRRGTAAPASALDRGRVDRLDRGERLVERQDPVVERLLAADPRGDVAGVVHPQLEAAGQVALGLVELVVGDQLVAQPRELDEDRLERRRQAGRIDAGRDLEGAGVGVVDEPGRRRRRRARAPRGPTGTAGCSSRRRGRR